MRRILLAWEIGAGFGHLARLIPVARHFQQRGDHVELAVRDPRALATASGRAPMPGRQAPHLTRGLTGPPVSLNYADSLMRNGYVDARAVRGLIEQWIAVIDEVRPDLVVLDHAPGALLAASLQELPRIVIGTGFTVPPLLTPQPSIQPWFDVVDEALDRREHALLAVINPALRDLGGSPLASVAAMFTGAERCICTWPELDHYDRCSTDAFIGPIGGIDGGDVSWPDGDGPRVFFYGHSPRVMEPLQTAIARHCRIVVYRPGCDAPPDLPSRVTWLSTPAGLETLTATADLAVCEAPGTATRFLLHGVPALLMPAHLEQELWAHRVAGRGLARSIGLLRRAGARNATEAFDEALTSPRLRSRVKTFAADHPAMNGQPALTRLTDRCEALLG